MFSSVQNCAQQTLFFQVKNDGVPKFDFSNWNPDVSWSPEAPPGLKFLSLVALNRGYEVAPYEQHDHVGKMRVSTAHRKSRQQEFKSGRTTGKNILGE